MLKLDKQVPMEQLPEVLRQLVSDMVHVEGGTFMMGGDDENAFDLAPRGGSRGRCRIYRGGSCANVRAMCRISARGSGGQALYNYNIGFRLAR